MAEAPLSAEALITVLKHPLTHAGDRERGHGLLRERLELYLRGERVHRDLAAEPLPYPGPRHIRAFAEVFEAEDWGEWLIGCFCRPPAHGTRPLPDWVADHVGRTEAIVAGTAGEPSELWAKQAGIAIRAGVDDLEAEAAHGADLSARDYSDLFAAILRRVEVRDRDAPHPHIRILGTLEARVMGADLMILAGLNDGIWPEIPAADPWLNRRMRADAGLLLPERRVGLSAHDFQQAIGAREVWLTRAEKSDDAETVPSRWLNRITNLMSGLESRSGPKALAEMKARGRHWLGLARALEAPVDMAAEPRPSPVPPVEARPTSLRVTRIKTLIRDPYAIYAAHVLKLNPLPPLQRAPDALLRGTTLHDVLHRFVEAVLADEEALTEEQMMAEVHARLAEVPFPMIRQLWAARMARVVPGFVADERQRLARARPSPQSLEIRGEADIPHLGFTLRGTADRIDIDARGGAWIYDYKTGNPPSSKQERYFDKQLYLEAGIAGRGGFGDLAPRHIAGLAYIGLGSKPGEVPLDIEETPPDTVWAEFEALIAGMLDEDHGFTARRAMQEDNAVSDYDHLSRLGEWELTDPPQKERME